MKDRSAILPVLKYQQKNLNLPVPLEVKVQGETARQNRNLVRTVNINEEFNHYNSENV